MTREEAIQYLQQLYPNGGHCWLDEQRIEAIGMAVKALQEESVSEQNLSNVERIRKNWKEEPISEDLEEACEQLSEDARKHKAETSSPFFSQTDYKQGVMDGAKWQKKQMMKDAIERVVKVDAGGYPYIDGTIELYDYSEDKPLAKAGDKVKIIIVKED